MNTAEALSMHIENLERVLIAFATKDVNAISLLENAKKVLSETKIQHDTNYDFYKPAAYNALAVINSAPNQEKINLQLEEAVIDAKEELKAIFEYLKDLD